MDVAELYRRRYEVIITEDLSRKYAQNYDHPMLVSPRTKGYIDRDIAEVIQLQRGRRGLAVSTRHSKPGHESLRLEDNHIESKVNHRCKQNWRDSPSVVDIRRGGDVTYETCQTQGRGSEHGVKLAGLTTN